MKVASGLASGRDPVPELARDAVAAALAAAGVERAETLLLFLTHDFTRHPQPALLAATRAAGCIAVAGSTVGGLFTEAGWVLDQPAAAALVIADASPAGNETAAPRLSFSGHYRLPFDWQAGPARAGLLATDAAVWSHGRLAADQCADLRLPGIRARLVHSDGLRRLGPGQTVAGCRGHELIGLGGTTAAASLRRALPDDYRESPPLHLIAALRADGSPPLALLSINADGSLTLSEMLDDGEMLVWALRQPWSAEAEIRQSLAAAVDSATTPDFALMFSCIGRGPLFYGDDDRDLGAFRDCFPATPLLGAYGSGQIVPTGAGNRLFQNTVLTLLCESSHAV